MAIEPWKRPQPRLLSLPSPPPQVVVALRTRPFLEREVEAAGLEHQKQVPRGVDAVNPLMIIHTEAMKWNGPSVEHKAFSADLSFGPDDKDEDVYRCLVTEPKMLETVFGGGMGCILSYGQTSSGKTYTTSHLLSNLAATLFPSLVAFALDRFPSALLDQGKKPEEVLQVSLAIWEILGSEAKDLGKGKVGEKVVVGKDQNGEVLTSASTLVISSGEELADAIQKALSERSTAATAKNDESSRSHCLITIQIANTLFPALTPGTLTFVDLAGSERAADRKNLGTDRMEESREINKSLSNLKDCLRLRAEADQNRRSGKSTAFTHVPYRSNKLTLALKPVFDLEATRHCKTVIVAHASPHVSDSVHTKSTLTYIQMFRVAQPATPSTGDGPASWTNAQFRDWVTKSSSKIDAALLAPFETGVQMTKLSEEVFVARCLEAQKPGSGLTEKGAKSFYKLLWTSSVDSRQGSRTEVLKTRKTPYPFSSWMNQQVADWLEKVSDKVDPDIFCPAIVEVGVPLKGKSVIEMGEAEFISRIIASPFEGKPPATTEEAKEIFAELWKEELDPLNSSRRETLANTVSKDTSGVKFYTAYLENLDKNKELMRDSTPKQWNELSEEEKAARTLKYKLEREALRRKLDAEDAEIEAARLAEETKEKVGGVLRA